MSDGNEGAGVVHNEEQHRFEIDLDGLVSVAEYSRDEDRITFTHTVVPPELQGGGVGNQLAQAGLEYARDQGLEVVPQCSFIAGYIERNPEYRDLVAG